MDYSAGPSLRYWVAIGSFNFAARLSPFRFLCQANSNDSDCGHAERRVLVDSEVKLVDHHPAGIA